jgi:hypothetical protein
MAKTPHALHLQAKAKSAINMTGAHSEMASSDRHEIVIRVDTISQLFNGSDVNPFSSKDADILGEPALLRTVRRLLGRRMRNWDDVQLTIKLPPDQITPDLQEKTAAAINRYATAKIEDNKLTIRLSRLRGAIGLLIVTLVTLVVLALASLLVSNVLANADPVLQGLVVASASVFAWVIMWDPLERLLFDWVGPSLENRILRRVMRMKVVVEPDS